MSIESLNSSFTANLQATTSAAAVARRKDTDGDNEGGTRAVSGRKARSEVLSAVTQALGSLGLTVPAKESAAKAGATEPSRSDGNSGSSDVQQALSGFMHNLFQTLRSQGGNAPTGNADSDGDNDGTTRSTRGADEYKSDLTSKVQNLIQSLSSQSSGATQTGSLQSSFDALVKDLQASDGETASSTAAQQQPDLKSFLQNFLQNLQAGGSFTSTVGANVNTVV